MILVFLGKYARYIPYAVLAGILMVTSARMMDTWSFGLIRRRSTLRDMAIVVLVAGTTLLVDLMIAVGLGVVITVILFIRDQVKRSVIKDRVSGRRARSKKVRATDELEYLRMKGHKILVYTLEGTIFFGTADGMMQAIEKDAADAEVVILDLRLVQEIDLTGVQILRQLDDHMKEQDKLLLLSYVTDAAGHGHGPIAGFLSDVGLLEQMGPERLFEDTDRALEWAEDHLLQRAYGQSGDYSRRIDLRDMKIFQYLSDREIAYLAKILTHSEYKTGDIIFEEGDAGNTMYLVSSGSVSILLEIGKGERKKRVASFGRGVFFGEMALLENKPRSATAMAEEETGLYVLKREDFFRLLDKKPKIASKIQVGIARELSGRLRATDEELRALEM
jgi:SulP family sulfate permease